MTEADELQTLLLNMVAEAVPLEDIKRYLAMRDAVTNLRYAAWQKGFEDAKKIYAREVA